MQSRLTTRGALALGVVALVGTAACPSGEPLADIRFNAESDRLYLEGTGCITPSDIYGSRAINADLPLKAVHENGTESEAETG